MVNTTITSIIVLPSGLASQQKIRFSKKRFTLDIQGSCADTRSSPPQGRAVRTDTE